MDRQGLQQDVASDDMAASGHVRVHGLFDHFSADRQCLGLMAGGSHMILSADQFLQTSRLRVQTCDQRATSGHACVKKTNAHICEFTLGTESRDANEVPSLVRLWILLRLSYHQITTIYLPTPLTPFMQKNSTAAEKGAILRVFNGALNVWSIKLAMIFAARHRSGPDIAQRQTSVTCHSSLHIRRQCNMARAKPQRCSSHIVIV